MPGESPAQPLSGEMSHHIFRELGFKSIKEYLDWCEANHFRVQVNKSKHQIRSEREFARTGRANEALKKKHGTRNLAQALARIWSGNLGEKDPLEGRKGSRNMKIWHIRELLSSMELEDEGQAMGHCVATYAHSCHRGLSSIWSMSCETEAGAARRLTLEVRQKTKEIVQARGRRNRLPEAKEIEVLRRWATREGLTIAEWIL